MSACCHDHGPEPGNHVTITQRRALWAALIINAAMFVTEMTGAFFSHSVGLQADAVDFFGDAANYGLSLAVLGMGMAVRSKVALFKGLTMVAFGLWVGGAIVHHAMNGTVPSAPVMGVIGFAALCANVICAVILFKFRGQDANMKSVWICSRNDAISNIAVMLAASGVWVSASGLPDLFVGALIGALALSGGVQVIRAALSERRELAAACEQELTQPAPGDD